MDAEEPGQDRVADAGGDGERGGDVVDATARGLPHIGQLEAVAALGGLVDDGGGQGTVGAEEAGVAVVYELGGTAFTMPDLAAEVSRQTGKPLTYQDMPVDQYAKALAGAGPPEAFADLLADTSLAATPGDWYTDSTDLPRLIGRPSTPPTTAVADALRAGPAGSLDPRG